MDKRLCVIEYHSNVPFALTKYISYKTLTSKYKAYLTAFSNIVEPSSYTEAIKDP
ncbi:hypothetical protein HAX54_036631, partial [Datura stramonium]|nr:hypothetical protein [Datura stramonium]